MLQWCHRQRYVIDNKPLLPLIYCTTTVITLVHVTYKIIYVSLYQNYWLLISCQL